ncbi:MAG: TIR domain-containing protein [Pseudomonadota bacterium]
MPRRSLQFPTHCHEQDCVLNVGQIRLQIMRQSGSDFAANQQPVSANDWETVKKGGDSAIKKWITDNMNNRTCVVVLIGEETASRPWVQYEIEKAWKDGRGLLGIHIHNLNCPNGGKGTMGKSPFDGNSFKDTDGKVKTIPCKNPSSSDAYGDIKKNLEAWIEEAIALRA